MNHTHLLHQLILASAQRDADAPALIFGNEQRSYAQLEADIRAFASGLRQLGLERSERVGIYLDKRIETVVGMFGSTAAGGVFVPVTRS